MKRKVIYLLMVVILLACDRSYTPKPMGYTRVHYPEKRYIKFDTDAPYTFEYPAYSVVLRDRDRRDEPYWYNIYFPEYNGMIHLSYKKVEDNVDVYIEDSRTLVYKHTSRAEGIDEVPFMDSIHRRYGIMYDLKGNVASSIQFFITDSTTHFLRGSLYFNTSPNRDSLNPIINFVRQDIEHLLETVEWR